MRSVRLLEISIYMATPLLPRFAEAVQNPQVALLRGLAVVCDNMSISTVCQSLT